MALIDPQGRLFGRWNLVDAALVLLLIAALPAAYGSYLLFREPAPRLTEVVPSSLKKGPNLQVEVHGENFRPYMRVSFGHQQGVAFFFNNPGVVVVPLPALEPGQYDVVLYDYMQEVARLPKALTITAPPLPPAITVEASGAFTGVTKEHAAKIVTGLKLPETGDPAATVKDVGTPTQAIARVRASETQVISVPVDDVEVPATIALTCFMDVGPDGILRCSARGVVLGPDVNIVLPAFNGGPRDGMNFRINRIHYNEYAGTAEARVVFTGSPAVRAAMRPGDLDIGGRAFPTGLMATLVSVSPSGGGVEGVVRVPVDRGSTAWTYKGLPVKVGALFGFETLEYSISGTVIAVTLPRSEIGQQRPEKRTP